MEILIEENYPKFLEIFRFAVAQKISYLNLPIPSNQFAKEEPTSERFPKNDILGIWQSLIGTLTEKLGLVVLKEAQFGCWRWSYVQRTFANLRPKSSCWNNQPQKNFQLNNFIKDEINLVRSWMIKIST